MAQPQSADLQAALSEHRSQLRAMLQQWAVQLSDWATEQDHRVAAALAMGSKAGAPTGAGVTSGDVDGPPRPAASAAAPGITHKPEIVDLDGSDDTIPAEGAMPDQGEEEARQNRDEVRQRKPPDPVAEESPEDLLSPEQTGDQSASAQLEKHPSKTSLPSKEASPPPSGQGRRSGHRVRVVSQLARKFRKTSDNDEEKQTQASAEQSNFGVNRLKREIRATAQEDDDQPPAKDDLVQMSNRSRRSWAMLLVTRTEFEALVGLIIVANCITVTVDVSLGASPPFDGHTLVSTLEACFYIFFLVELILRMIAWRCLFFVGVEKGWNFFDIIVMVITSPGMVSFVMGDEGQDVGGVNFSIARVARLMRLAKLLRLLRVLRRLDSLWLALQMLSFGLWSSLPVLSATFGCLYIVALVILALVGDHLQDRQSKGQDLDQALLEHWSTLGDVLHSSLACLYGGADWDEKAGPLRKVGGFAYGLFLVQVLTQALICGNLVVSTFVCLTNVATMGHVDSFELRMQRRKQFDLVTKMERLVGTKTLDYPTFYSYLMDGEGFSHFVLFHLGMSLYDAEYLFYTLTASGTEEVDIQTFVLGCIEMRSSVSKLDIVRMKSNFDAALEEHAEQYQHQLAMIGFKGSMRSFQFNELSIRDAAVEEVPGYLESIFCRLSREEDQQDFRRTSLALLDLVQQAQGGCGFIITTPKGYASMKTRRIDFQVVDRNKNFPDGYMTMRLKGNHITEELFAQAIRDFTAHGEADRWSPGHEAEGLPMDGYIALSAGGTALKAAVRVAGLPTPPLQWNNVGTRHLAALAMTWVLRLYPALVVVRSDTGKCHFLYTEGVDVVCLNVIPGQAGTSSPLKNVLSIVSRHTSSSSGHVGQSKAPTEGEKLLNSATSLFKHGPNLSSLGADFGAEAPASHRPVERHLQGGAHGAHGTGAQTVTKDAADEVRRAADSAAGEAHSPVVPRSPAQVSTAPTVAPPEAPQDSSSHGFSFSGKSVRHHHHPASMAHLLQRANM